jgi:flagellar assembly protein FliH
MPDTFLPKEQLSAYERWEIGSLLEPRGKAGGDARRANDPAAETPATTTELQRITAEAHKAGYAAGLKEGRARAEQEIQRLMRAAEQAESLIANEGEQFAAEMLDLALDLARQMVRTELKVRRESLLAVVREALDCLPHGASGAQLVMNPADVELVRGHVGEELKAGAIRLVEDHRIEPGGCRIVSPACEVDATLATRWKRLVATLGVDHNWLEP